jgi:hypothetical protein
VGCGRLSQLAGAPKSLPFYIMTSPLNDRVTRCVRRGEGGGGSQRQDGLSLLDDPLDIDAALKLIFARPS